MSSQPGHEGATAALARHVAELDCARLPAEAVHAFRRALVDWLACVLAGSTAQAPRILLDYLQDFDTAREACVFGTPHRLSAPHAAFVNGAATHALDFDDGHTRGSVHPAGSVFPALFAMAERSGAGAADLIAAGVAAYDVTTRVASAVHPHSARRGFHNTPLAGVFGAAAAAARLLRLDARTTRDALGLAGSFAGGLRAYLDEGAEVKRIHPGKAARDGIVCAELARRGLTGPHEVLEARHGFLNAMATGAGDAQCLRDGLGSRFEICNAYFKPYPACRHFHAALDAVRALAADHAFAPRDVVRVEIGMYETGVAGHDHVHAENLLDAQMSAPVTTALALVQGNVTAASFAQRNLDDPEVRRLVGATRVYVDAQCEALYPGRRGGVARLHLADGRVLEQRVLDPRGEGENPMSDEDLGEKLLANAEPFVGRARCAALLEAAWALGPGARLDPFYAW